MTPTERRLAASLAEHYARKAARGDDTPMPIADAIIQLRRGGLGDDLRAELEAAGVTVRGPHRIEFDPARLAAGVVARDMTASSAVQGGYLKSTDVGTLEPAPAAVSALRAAGARFLRGLVGDVTIPRITGSASRVVLATEGATTTESQQTLASVALTPKTAGVYVELSRLVPLQAPVVAQVIERDLLDVHEASLDAFGIAGTGVAGQPTGIINTVGIGTQSGSSLAWTGILEMRRLVRVAKGQEASTAWICDPDTAKLLGARETSAGSGFILSDGHIDGRPVFVTTNCPTATLILGDFNQLVVGQWGGVTLEWDPRANFVAGIRAARMLSTIDIALLTPGAFVVATSVT